MATTQVRTADEMPPPARRRGRPPKQRPDPVDDDRDLTASAGEDLEDEQETASGAPVGFKGANTDEFFTGYLTQFSADQWSQNLLAYWYRTAPTINTKRGGKPAYIRKMAEYFDADTIKKLEGSGGYRIDLTWRDPQNSRQSRLASVYVDILDQDFPPRVPAGDWIDDPINDMWRWAKPSINANGHYNGTTVVQVPPQEGADPEKLFNTILTGVRTLTPKEDTGTLQIVLELIRNQSNAKPDTSKDAIIQMLRDDLKAYREELLEMRKAQMNQPAPKSLLDQVQEIIPAVQTFADSMGFSRRGTGKSNEWADVAREGFNALKEFAPALYQILQRGGQPQGFGGLRLQPGQAQPQPQPAAAAPAAAGQPAAEEPAKEPIIVKTPPERLQEIYSVLGQQLIGIAPQLVDMFRNSDGYEMRDWLLSRYGINSYNFIKAKATAAELADLAQVDDRMREALSPREKFEQFLNEFYTPEGEEPQEEGEPGDGSQVPIGGKQE